MTSANLEFEALHTRRIWLRAALLFCLWMSLLTLLSSSALAATGTITYSGTLFVDNGYGGGTAGNGVQDGTELGVGNLNNVSVNYVLTNASGGTNSGNFNTSTNGSGVFSLSINAPSGYSLTQLVFNRSDSFINAYSISGGTTGSIKGTLVANSAAQVTMTWPTGAVASGVNVTGGFVGLIGNTSIGGDVFMNNGPNGGEAGNKVQDADEPGFTAFPVAIVVTYVDLATNQPMTLNMTTNTTTGVYPTFMVPRYTQNLKFTVDNVQFNNAGYFVNEITPPSNGTSWLQIGDGQPSQGCTQVTLTGEWGTFQPQQFTPCYANLNPTIVTIGNVNQGETAVSFGAVLFNTLVSTSPASQVVLAGTPATYEYKYTSYSSDMRLNFVLTGGTNPVFYIKEPSGNVGNPDCSQPYDTVSTGSQYLNWGATIFPGKVVCIEVLDTPASNNPDQLILHALYQYNTENNPWTVAAGTTQTATSVAGYAVSGTVFVDDGSGGGSANNSTKQAAEAGYSGATITAAYTYIGLGGVSTAGSGSTTTNTSGAFTIAIPTKATNVVITRSGWASYMGTGGLGGTSTVKGIYVRGTTAAAGDTVTIASLTDGVSGIAFGIVALDTLAPNGTKTTSPGTTIYYPHTFIAYTAGKATFSSSDASGWTTAILNDPTCSGVYVSSATNPVQGAMTYSNLTATTSSPGILCVLEAVTVPGTATAGPDAATVSARYDYLNGAATVFTYVITATDTTTVTTTISGTVYVDTDHDGSMDTGETAYSTTPVLYAKLFISSSGTAVAVVPVTAGTFSFAVPAPAGTYTIHLSTNNTTTSSTEIPPPGYLETQNAGGYTFVRAAGGQTGINFGLYSGSKVSGWVFIDNGAGGGTAADGILNGSEAGISGITVSEAASVGSPCTTSVCQTTTATDGTFTLYVPSGQASAIISRTAVTGYMAVKGKAGTTGGTWAASPEAVTFTPVAGTIYTGVTFGEVYMSVTMVKTADKTSANPGDKITYTLQFGNLMLPSLLSSSIALGNLTIVDTVPANTTFVSASGSGCGSGTLPPGLTSCTLTPLPPAVGGTGPVTWTFLGSLTPGSSGSVTLVVKVK